MAKIQFNKVTWYSKLIALVLFIAMPLVGFYLGAYFQKTLDSLHAVTPPAYMGQK